MQVQWTLSIVALMMMLFVSIIGTHNKSYVGYSFHKFFSFHEDEYSVSQK